MGDRFARDHCGTNDFQNDHDAEFQRNGVPILFPIIRYRRAIQIHLNLLREQHARDIELPPLQSELPDSRPRRPIGGGTPVVD